MAERLPRRQSGKREGNAEVKKWNMVIDCARCHDCNDCFLADKDEFVGNDFPPYSVAQPWSGHRWMNIERKERGQYPIVQPGYLPKPCQHCADAPCMDGFAGRHRLPARGRPGAHRPERAKGHPEIVDTCPYGAIYWNAEATSPRSAPAARTSSTPAGPRPAARRSARPTPSSWCWPMTRSGPRSSQRKSCARTGPTSGPTRG